MPLTKVSYSMIVGACSNVLDFGASPSASAAANSAAFTAAIAASLSIYIPNGTYNLTSALVITGAGVNIFGAGSTTVLNFSTLASGHAISFGNGTTQASGCHLSNVSLVGGGGASGLRLFGGAGGAGTVACHFTNVFVSGFAVNLTTGDAWTNQFSNCRFNASTGVSAVIGAASNNNLFDRCTFNNATQSLAVINSEGNQFNSCEFAEISGAVDPIISLSQSLIVLINPYIENITSSIIATVGIPSETIKSALIIEGGQCNITTPLVNLNSNKCLVRITGMAYVTNDITYYDTGAAASALYAQVYPSEIATTQTATSSSQFNALRPVFYGNQNPPTFNAGGGVTFVSYRNWIEMAATTVVGRGISLSSGAAVVGEKYTVVLSILGAANNAQIGGGGAANIGLTGYQTAGGTFEVLYIPITASSVDVTLTCANLNDPLQIKFAAILKGHKFPRFDVYRTPSNILSTTAPTVDEWFVGDEVQNSVPAVGQPKGWICTVTGTPGTWVSSGNL